MSDLDAVFAQIDADIDNAIAHLFETLRLKSISADAALIGFGASVCDTAGHPMVGSHDRAASGTSALFYGHHDAQLVAPLALWENGPFDHSIETRTDVSRLTVGHGSTDNKGQRMIFVEACRHPLTRTRRNFGPMLH